MKLEKIFSKYPDILCAYKFGSQVRGDAIGSSDLDIAVVHENPQNLDYGRLYGEVQRAIKKHELDLRIINSDTSPVFLKQVINGEVVYENDPLDRIEFEVKAMKAFYDTQHIREIYKSYLNQAFI